MDSRLKNLYYVQWMNRYPALGIRQDQWVFSSTENRHFDSNARYLFIYVYENLQKITPVYVMNDPGKRERLQKAYPRAKIVDTDTRAGIRTVLESGVWFTSAGLPVYGVGLSKGRLVVNLWHGVPLKKITLVEHKRDLFYRMYFPMVFSRNYSWVVTTSSHLVPLMQASFGVRREQVKVLGQPRNDGLFRTREAAEVLGGLYKERTLPDFEKAVLYAPTHRDGEGIRLFPFWDHDSEALTEFLEREKILLCIRMHSFVGSAGHPGQAACGRGDARLPDSPWILWLDEERAEDVMEVLDVFDLLITDYSSIYIDFLLTGKPMLFLPYDKKEYLQGRGLNFPYGRVTPGPKPDTFKGFCEQVKGLLAGDDPYKERRQKANRYFNEVDGPCCGQICAQVQKYLKETEV